MVIGIEYFEQNQSTKRTGRRGLSSLNSSQFSLNMLLSIMSLNWVFPSILRFGFLSDILSKIFTESWPS